MFHVTVLPGDGIGPEITQSAVNVLKAAAELFQIELSFSTCDFGGISLDRHGVPVQEGVLAACRSSDAVLLGAVGGPPGIKAIPRCVRRRHCCVCEAK